MGRWLLCAPRQWVAFSPYFSRRFSVSVIWYIQPLLTLPFLFIIQLRDRNKPKINGGSLRSIQIFFSYFFFLFFIFSFGNDEKFTRQTRTHTAGPVSSSEEADFCVLCLLQRSRRVCGACNWSRTARGPTETIYRFDFIMTAGRNKTRKIEMEKSGERERERKKTTRFNGTRNLSLFFHGYCSASLRLPTRTRTLISFFFFFFFSFCWSFSV